MPAAPALLPTDPPRVERQSADRTGRIRRGPAAKGLAVLASAYRPVLMAIEVLDELVAAIVRKNAGHVPRDFLDWVADDMTPWLEALALEHFADQERRGTSTVRQTRDWVIAVSQWRLDQKMHGWDPSAPGHDPQANSATDTH